MPLRSQKTSAALSSPCRNTTAFASSGSSVPVFNRSRKYPLMRQPRYGVMSTTEIPASSGSPAAAKLGQAMNSEAAKSAGRFQMCSITPCLDWKGIVH